MAYAIRSIVLTAACAAIGAHAQMLSPGYGTYGAPMSSYLASSYLLQQVANGTRAAGSGKSANVSSSKGASAEVRFTTGARPIAPKKLAQSYPAASRAQAEQFFLQTLDGYHKIEAQFGLRRYDMAGAIATFVAGNYIAYRDEPFPDQSFPPLVRQIRGAMGSVEALRHASDSDKQELYEQLAILGTYMALTREALARSPDPKLAANMKLAAKGYLQQFLKVDPERMQITAQGLTLN